MSEGPSRRALLAGFLALPVAARVAQPAPVVRDVVTGFVEFPRAGI